MRFSCHKISEGKAQAEAIVSKDRIMFYQVRPEDGMMEEKTTTWRAGSLPGRFWSSPAERAALWSSRTACITWTASTICPPA